MTKQRSISDTLGRGLVTSCALLALAACSDSTPGGDEAQTPAKPAQSNSSNAASTPSADSSAAAPESGAAFTVDAPAGTYRLDPNHTSLAFTVRHLGLSNYIVRFAKHDVTIDLKPDNMAQSSVMVTVDPTSVSTLYSGDYKATHPDSKFAGWNEDLAKSDKFFNAEEYPEIRFESTEVKPVGKNELEITGDLTLLGKTRPITLDAVLIGSAEKHPVYQDVQGAMGFSAIGEFKRSDFGMDYLLKPPLIGDNVVVNFEGEFQQQTEE